MSLHQPAPLTVDGARVRVGIVAARFNAEWVDRLLERCTVTLHDGGVGGDQLTVVRVPGSQEVPWTVAALAAVARTDVIIALGVLLQGATSHHELIGGAVAEKLLAVSLERNVPVINGVIVVDSEAQAEERVGPALDRGAEFAHAALEMAAVRATLRSKLFR